MLKVTIDLKAQLRTGMNVSHDSLQFHMRNTAHCMCSPAAARYGDCLHRPSLSGFPKGKNRMWIGPETEAATGDQSVVWKHGADPLHGQRGGVARCPVLLETAVLPFVIGQLRVEFFEYSEVYSGVHCFVKEDRANNALGGHCAPHPHLLWVQRLLMINTRIVLGPVSCILGVLIPREMKPLFSTHKQESGPDDRPLSSD